MTKKILVYDLETCNAIPPKRAIDRLPDINYCEGWDDFENMGISAISWCLMDAESFQSIEIGVSQLTPHIENRFHDFIEDSEIKIGGFNSSKFDDKLFQANGLHLISDFDILTLILRSAGVAGTEYWKKGLQYNLASIAQANGVEKTGTGENAPLLYQKNRISDLLLYCFNDSVIESYILSKLLNGDLIDPNTGSRLVPIGWGDGF
jgi:hypothetical protein